MCQNSVYKFLVLSGHAMDNKIQKFGTACKCMELYKTITLVDKNQSISLKKNTILVKTILFVKLLNVECIITYMFFSEVNTTIYKHTRQQIQLLDSITLFYSLSLLIQNNNFLNISDYRKSVLTRFFITRNIHQFIRSCRKISDTSDL